MQATEQQLTIALKQRVQGFNYTQLELVNWMCTEFDITLILSEKLVAELGLHK
jgi:hypothetical protein